MTIFFQPSHHCFDVFIFWEHALLKACSFGNVVNEEEEFPHEISVNGRSEVVIRLGKVILSWR